MAMNIKLNCMLSSSSIRGLKVYRFEIIPQTDKPIDLTRIGRKIVSRIQDIPVVHTGKFSLYCQLPGKMPKDIIIDGVTFELREKGIELIDPNNDTHVRIIERCLSEQIEKELFKMGYTQIDNNVIYKEEFTSSGNIESHPAVEYQIQLTPKGRVMLFVDIQQHWVCPLLKFLKSMKSNSPEEMLEFLIGREMMVHIFPEKLRSMRVIKYLDVFHTQHHLNLAGHPSLFDYWNSPPSEERYRIEGIKKKLKYSPKATDKGIFILKKEDKELDFPPDVLRVKIDLKDTDLLEILDLNAEKAKLTPKDREGAIQKIFNSLCPIDYRIFSTAVKFEIDGKPLWGTSEELKKDGFEIHSLDLPSLEFSKNYKVQFESNGYIINDALKKVGPYSGPKNIIVDIIVPEGTRTDNINTFFNQVTKIYRIHNFGNITKGETIFAPDKPIAYGATASSFYHNLSDNEKQISNRFMMGILPSINSDDCHHELNKELLQLKVPSKCMKFDNFRKIDPQRGSYSLFSIVSEIYDRVLRTGEATWILADKAGKSNLSLQSVLTEKQIKKESDEFYSMYIGFDISRNKGKPEVGSYAAICEPHGRVVNAQYKPFKGEYLTAEDVREIINNSMREFEITKRELKLPTPDQIVFFKDGDTRGPLGRRAVEDGLNYIKDDLISAKRAKEGLRISYVLVKKRIIHRIFGETGHVKEGVCIINKEYRFPEAILITTTPLGYNLTQAPNKIVLMLQINDNDPTEIYRIAKEYNDLRFLHWETWRFQPGAALPLHIVQHKAKQLSYGYDTVYIPK